MGAEPPEPTELGLVVANPPGEVAAHGQDGACGSPLLRGVRQQGITAV